jgi:hypothetical protein
MHLAISTHPIAPGEAPEAVCFPAAPLVEREACTPAELRAWFRSGDPTVEELERALASAASARGILDVAIAEGLDALGQGERLAVLGYHLDDYAREVLDLGKRAAEELARLGRALRTRPLLREALVSGRIGLRAAQTIVKVAAGDAEASWVERAAGQSVRELEDAVRRAGDDPADADEEWLRLAARLTREERILLDEALALAGEVHPDSTRFERVEAMAQELLAELGTDGDGDETRPLGRSFKRIGPGEAPRRAALEAETERWSALPAPAAWPAPDVRFYDTATPQAIDAQLRDLAARRASWDDLVGFCGHAVNASRLYHLLGFASFRHYVEERLQLSPRAVEQRVALERRLSGSSALREARRQGIGYEKLRLLARLPDQEVGSWTPRAHALTCIDLARAVDDRWERQMRASRKLGVPMPRRVAVLVAAVFEAIRERADGVVSAGRCLAIMAWHFIETWKDLVKPRRSRSRKVRSRDRDRCRVPACSHRAADAHHVKLRSRGGGDGLENQIGVCRFHHHRCIHAGWLRVEGCAPDGLTWTLYGGEEFTGRPR